MIWTYLIHINKNKDQTKTNPKYGDQFLFSNKYED